MVTPKQKEGKAMRRVVCSCCLILLIVLAGVPAQALEPLAPYDTFQGTLINPDKWFGGESFVLFPRSSTAAVVGWGTEALREIQGNRLNMAYQAYGNTNANSGFIFSALNLFFTNPAAVTAIAASVKVDDVEDRGCPSNPGPTQAHAQVLGAFFNTGTPTPTSGAVNDVRAAIFVRHLATDPPDVLEVVSALLRCTDLGCLPSTNEVIDVDVLGPIKKNTEVRLQVQWDPANDRFLFQRDNEPPVISSYAPRPDTASPGVPFKALGVVHFVATCTNTPRPASFMDASFDEVFVNASAAP